MSFIRAFFKVGFVLVFVAGMLGVGAFVGLCAVGDAGPCASGDGEPAGPLENSSPVGQDPLEKAANTDVTPTDPPDEEQAGGDGTESPTGDAADGDEDDDGDREWISGPEPPTYPERTHKGWDRELSFAGDPGNTVANGSFWSVDSEDVERFLAQKVNDYRAANGLDRQSYSHALASVSRAHSADMARRGYFAHPNPDGERAWDRWGSEHCRSWYSENLFRSYAGTPVEGEPEPLRTAEGLARTALEGWQNSPPHDEAMREPTTDAAGYGVYFAALSDEPGYAMYVTMNMCVYNENPGP